MIQKMRDILIFLILIISNNFLFCQKATNNSSDSINTIVHPNLKYLYIGITYGLCNDAAEFTENESNIYRVPCISNSFGLTIKKYLNKSLSIESGVISKPYTVGFGINAPSFYMESNSSSALTIQVPIRLNSKINLYKNKVFLGGTVGYVFAFNTDPGRGDTSGFYNPKYSNSSKSSLDSVFYSSRTLTTNDKHFSLIQSALSLEVFLFQNISLEISYSYYTGFEHFQDTKIFYIINNSPVQISNMFMSGSYSSFEISLHSPIHKRAKKRTNTYSN
jgi:hypothetical protein